MNNHISDDEDDQNVYEDPDTQVNQSHLKQYNDVSQCYVLTGEAKIQGIKIELQRIINESGDEKIIFFAHHLKVLQEIKRFCREINCNSVEIFGKRQLRGSVKQQHVQEKHRIAEIFRDQQQNVKIAILSLTSASLGLDLKAASIIVFGELYWNNGVMQQAIARCYRRGQTRNVKCYYLIGQRTLDQKQLKIINDKKNVEQLILDSQESDYEESDQDNFQDSDYDYLDDDDDLGNQDNDGEDKDGEDNNCDDKDGEDQVQEIPQQWNFPNLMKKYQQQDQQRTTQSKQQQKNQKLVEKKSNIIKKQKNE